MTTSNSSSANSLILPFQKPIYERLCAVARACLYVDRRQFSVLKLRTCFWLIGPSGAGKTFLAKNLGEEMNVPFLAVAISDWIILGGSQKGAATTWPLIFQFLEKSMKSQGAIIFIDELDKCRDQSNYNTFLRSEVFSLCDARIPLGIIDTEGEVVCESRIKKVQEFLSSKTMTIGGAAYQEIWEERSIQGIGFNPALPCSSQPELPELVRVLPRELVNRFASEMFILPQMRESDYRAMIEVMADHVPETWRKRFVELGLSRIEQAVRHQKGARFMEEILLSAVVEERQCMANFVPEPEATEDREEPDDLLGIF